MITVEKIEVWGFEHAIRGMRNPKNSWERSDSYATHVEDDETLQIADFEYFIGNNDLDLMRKLFKGGSEHRKYARQIFVSMDITAPLYWWKEFDTYKIGTTANSCSTMHMIHAKEFVLDDFSHEHLSDEAEDSASFDGEYNYTPFDFLKYALIPMLNFYRDAFIRTKNKKFWWQMIQLLPTSYNQKRTVTMTYENAINMLNQRPAHKLDEWNIFCDVLFKLPYMKDIFH